MLSLVKSKTRAASISRAQKTLWSDPKYRAKMCASRKGKPHPFHLGDKNPMRNPETVAKVKEILNTPEMKAKRSAIAKALPTRPSTEESRRKTSLTMKGRKFSEEHYNHLVAANRRPEVRKKHGRKGKENPNWKGGTSFEPYCPKFTEELKDGVRAEFHHKCCLCGLPENGRKHHVHHVDYNKSQGCGQRWTLVPLCASCHTKTNFRRWHWFALLSNYWLEKYLSIDAVICP